MREALSTVLLALLRPAGVLAGRVSLPGRASSKTSTPYLLLHDFFPMRTTHVKAADVEERWLVFDASKHNLGRLATRIATCLIGKDRPTYTPSEHGATHVIVINSANVVMTGKKNDAKEYQHYTGYPDGRKVLSTTDMRERRPNDMVTLAVRRMLPKNRLGKKMLSHLKVYPGAEHPHSAQKPTLVETL